MIRYPDIDKIAVDLGFLQIHWYGVMYLVGFAVAWWLGRVRARRPGSSWKPEDVDDFLFFAMLGVIIGGRVGYVLFYGLGYWMQDPLYPIRIWDGGMSFHGGLVGVLLALALFAKRRGRRIADVFDFAAPLPGIGFMAGRIGNFINDELWGRPTDVPWGFIVDGQGRHATQLYQAALEGLLLFLVLWWFTSKPRPRLAPSGLFLLVYGCARVFVEFWRVPDAHLGYLFGGWFTMGMLLSLPMIVVGIWLLVVAYRRNEPSGNWGGGGAVPAAAPAATAARTPRA